MKKDNTTLHLKTSLRRRFLGFLDDKPVVCETHGGRGKVWERVYSGLEYGVVFEKDVKKAEYLAMQRTGWAVYEADAAKALTGFADEFSVLDIDPYGEPWPVIDAFFNNDRSFAKKMIVCVNDGLRQKLRIQGGWTVKSLAGSVVKHGNLNLHSIYLQVCRELMAEKAAMAGYTMTDWHGYYCGNKNDMTHYAALLDR